MENSAFALEDTLAVYGIKKNPFPIDEVDDYFFSSPNLGKQLKVAAAAGARRCVIVGQETTEEGLVSNERRTSMLTIHRRK